MNSTHTMSIEAISQQDWKGKTVSQVLAATEKQYTEHLFVDNKPGSLTATGFHFAGEGWLYIYVTKFQHLERFNAERDWELEAFLQEEVDRVEFEGE